MEPWSVAIIYFFSASSHKGVRSSARLEARKGMAMPRPIQTFGAVALGCLIGFVATADAKTVHRHAHRHPGAEGRQIVVHGGESYLTAGTNVPVGSTNSYVLSTFGGGPTTFMPDIDHTFVGVRGLDRIPNNFTVPNCCEP